MKASPLGENPAFKFLSYGGLDHYHLFINLIVNHLTENGAIKPAILYESPFTDITPHGPKGLFSSDQIDKLLRILPVLNGSKDQKRQIVM